MIAKKISSLGIYFYMYIRNMRILQRSKYAKFLLACLWCFCHCCLVGFVWWLFVRVEKQNIEGKEFTRKSWGFTWRKTITNIKQFFVLTKSKLCFLAKMIHIFYEWTWAYKMFMRISSADGNEMNQLQLTGQDCYCICMYFKLLQDLKHQTVSHLNTSCLVKNAFLLCSLRSES